MLTTLERTMSPTVSQPVSGEFKFEYCLREFIELIMIVVRQIQIAHHGSSLYGRCCDGIRWSCSCRSSNCCTLPFEFDFHLCRQSLMFSPSIEQSTVKNGIISASAFQNDPGVQLLAFACAITASASWLMVCTKQGWPVSTTYSLISALAGVGVALGGPEAVQWGWNDGKGLGTIFAG